MYSAIKPTPRAYLPDLARSFVAVAQQRGRLAPFEVLHFAGHSITARQWLELLTPLAQAQGWVKPGHCLDNGKLRALLGTESHIALETAAASALQDLGLTA